MYSIHGTEENVPSLWNANVTALYVVTIHSCFIHAVQFTISAKHAGPKNCGGDREN